MNVKTVLESKERSTNFNYSKVGSFFYNGVKKQLLLDNTFLNMLELDTTIKPNKWLYLSDEKKINLFRYKVINLDDFLYIFNNGNDTSHPIYINVDSKDYYVKNIKIDILVKEIDEFNNVVSIMGTCKDVTDKNSIDFNKMYEIINTSEEISEESIWWMDLRKSDKHFFRTKSGAKMLGLEPNEDKKYLLSDYINMMERAIEYNYDYKEMIDSELESFQKAYRGESNYFGGLYPIISPEKGFLWIETKGKVSKRDEFGDPLLIIGVDSLVSKQVEQQEEVHRLRQFIDHGLKNADIGAWWIQIDNDKTTFNYTDTTRKLYGYERNQKQDPLNDEWNIVKNKIIKDYPEYKKYFDDDKEKFNKLYEGEIDNYSSIFPLYNAKGEVNWLEVRSTCISRNYNKKARLVVGATVDITDSYEQEILNKKLRRQNERLEEANKTAISIAELLVWNVDFNISKDGSLYYASDNYIKTLGLNKDKNGLVKITDFIETFYDDKEGIVSGKRLMELHNEFVNGLRDEYLEVVVKHRNLITGETIYLEHNSKVMERFEDGTVKIFGGYVKDITKKKQAENVNNELRRVNEQLQKANQIAIEAGKVMVWNINYSETDTEKIYYANDILIDTLGLDGENPHNFDIDHYYSTLYSLDDEGEKLKYKLNKVVDDVYENRVDSYSKILGKHKNHETNRIMYLEHTAHVEERYADGSVKIIGGFMVDVTDEVEKNKKIKYLAEHDILTGLYNRNYFERFVESNRLSDSYTIIICDVDGLKLINDVFGHKKGDECLVFVAELLTDILSDHSKIFRIGGDEFAIISSITEDKKINSLKLKIIDRMNECGKKNNIQAGVSIGYEIVNENDISFDQAFVIAENIMYRRKLTGRTSRKRQALEAILETLDAKTEETKTHCDRVANLAEKTLRKLGFTRESDIEDIRLLARVHDIGKITISEAILSKTDKLTREERIKINNHAEAGYKIVKNVVNSDRIADGVLYHHERIDGTGYPFGLKGDEIPLYAKIISVVDAYDVMTAGRPYREPITVTDAVLELDRCSNTQFDEDVVNAFRNVIKEDPRV